MLIQASNLIGFPIASIEEKRKIGIVKAIVVEKNTLKILGFMVSKGLSIFEKNLFLSNIDILDIDKYAVVTRTIENLVNPEEIVKVRNILNKKFNIFGLRASDKNKQFIGKVTDFIIDKETLSIIKFYIHNFWQDRILEANNIIKITNKEIIFDNGIDSLITDKTVDIKKISV